MQYFEVCSLTRLGRPLLNQNLHIKNVYILTLKSRLALVPLLVM